MYESVVPQAYMAKIARTMTCTAFGHILARTIWSASTLALAAALGPHDTGLLFAAIAIVGIGRPFGHFGLPMLMVSVAAPQWSTGQRAKAMSLMKRCLLIQAVSSVFAAVCAAAVFLFISSPSTTVAPAVFVGLFAASSYLSELGRSIILATAFPATAAVSDVVHALLLAPFAFLGLSMYGLVGVFACLSLLNLLRAVLQIIFVNFLSRSISNVVDAEPLAPHLWYSVKNCLAGVAGATQSQVSVLLLAAFIAPEQAAIFGIGNQVYNFLRSSLLAVRQSLLPIFSELATLHRVDELKKFGRLLYEGTTCGTIFFSMAWLIIGVRLIELTLGDSFVGAFRCVSVIFVAFAALGSALICNGILYSKKLSGTAATNVTVACLLNLVIVTISLVILTDGDHALIISLTHVATAIVFWIISYASLGYVGELWMPMRRQLLYFVLLIGLTQIGVHWGHQLTSIPIATAFIFGFAVLALFSVRGIRCRVRRIANVTFWRNFRIRSQM